MQPAVLAVRWGPDKAETGMTTKVKRPVRSDGPDVSILIAAWQAEEFLVRSIENALAQEGVSVEVIVVDDASTDNSFGVARAMADRDGRVTALRLAENAGPSGARNAALAQARGTWIAVLDADDRMVPRRLQRMIALAGKVEAEGGGADIVLGNLAEVDELGQPLSDEPFITDPDAPLRLTAEQFLAGNLRVVGGHNLGYLKPIVRRAFLEREGISYDRDLRNGEDFHLVLCCLLSGAKVWFSPDPDYLYTRRRGSISNVSAIDHLNALIRAETDMLVHPALTPELRELLDKRRRSLIDLRTTETILQALKARRIGRAREALAARPRAAVLVLRQLSEGLLRRLRRA